MHSHKSLVTHTGTTESCTERRISLWVPKLDHLANTIRHALNQTIGRGMVRVICVPFFFFLLILLLLLLLFLHRLLFFSSSSFFLLFSFFLFFFVPSHFFFIFIFSFFFSFIFVFFFSSFSFLFLVSFSSEQLPASYVSCASCQLNSAS